MPSNVTSTHAEFLAGLSNPRQTGNNNSSHSDRQQVEMSERNKKTSILRARPLPGSTSPPIKVHPFVRISAPVASQVSGSDSPTSKAAAQLDAVTEKLMKKSADDLLPRSHMIDYKTRSQLASLGLLSSLPLPQMSPRKKESARKNDLKSQRMFSGESVP